MTSPSESSRAADTDVPVQHPFGQKLEVLDFELGCLERQLGGRPAAFPDAEVALIQLRYLEKYVAARELSCQSILVEEHYIDRDHMEDHSVFYSRNFYPYPNHCKRVHFFRMPAGEVRERLGDLVRVGHVDGEEKYRRACQDLSEKNYLGFAVLRPLSGCPLGRTIVRCYPADGGGHKRDLRCTRSYAVHVRGVRLTVQGLPFQQQDKAVAACATTAIWCSLHMACESEPIALFTPAQITMRASQHSLPFGRAMPSEGLSLDQMCQAIHAAGVSPVLHPIREFEMARALLHASIESNIAPILILRRGTDWHAVTAIGMKLDKGLLKPGKEHIGDHASRLLAVYVHDDRFGPYLRADIQKSLDKKDYDSLLTLKLRFSPDKGLKDETWLLTHVLVPMHPKVRISLPIIRRVAVHTVSQIHSARQTLIDPLLAEHGLTVAQTVTYDTFVVKSARYLENLYLDGLTTPELAAHVAEAVSLARYVGVIRLSADYLDPIDVLIDTTSTDRNLHVIAVVGMGGDSPYTPVIVDYLASEYGCRSFTPTPAPPQA